MRGDILVETQRLMAQTISALADHVEQSTGYQLTPIKCAELPQPAKLGMLAVVTDANVSGGSIQWGEDGIPGGSDTVLVWFNGTKWTVVGK